MPTDKTYKIGTKRNNLFLRVLKGHFASANSHSNYYVDITVQKSRLTEAKAVAEELVSYYTSSTIVDAILCLDGTEVIGTCLAEELTKGNFMNMNAHRTIYVLSPEMTSGGQFIFRDGTVPMIRGKHVLILSASVTTGRTARSAIQAIGYYGGYVAGIASIFATANEIDGYNVESVFDPNDLGDYCSTSAQDCPMCKRGEKLDALINSFGYSKLH